MFNRRKHEVWASEIADYLNSQLIGEDFIVQGPNAIKTPRSFAKLATSSGGEVLLLTDRDAPGQRRAEIRVKNPDLNLARTLREFFASASIHTIHVSAIIAPEAKIGRNVQIGAHTIIGPDVQIGDNSIVLQNVVINGPAILGRCCVIKDGAVIGSEGYAFVEDEDGTPFHAPQLGRILIGDRVWVGSNSTVERAMIEDTVIHDDVKIDDLVHVGNGSVIGAKSMLTAGSVVANDAVIGQKVLIAPNAVIRERVTIADNVIVGLGAVVVKSIATSGVYAGTPAVLMKKRKP